MLVMFPMQRVAKLLVWMPCLVLVLLTSELRGQEPIPNGDDQRIQSQFKAALLKDDLRRVDEYRKNSKADKATKDRVAEYITKVYTKSLYSWGTDWQKLVDEGYQLLKKDNSVMTFEATAKAAERAGVHADLDSLKASMRNKEKALRPIIRKRFKREPGYSEAWWIYNEFRILEFNDARRKSFARVGGKLPSHSPVSKAYVDDFIERSAKWLAQQSDEGQNLRIAYDRINPINDLLLVPEYERFYQRCSELPKLDPWLLAMVGGSYQKKLAWDFRGNGFANGVSKENYKKFRERQRAARGFFQKAWNLRTDFPEPAVSMIGNALSAGAGDKSPRYWFDQAVAAEMDNEMAYDAMYNALQLKRGGSHKQILDFAFECVATQRYDSAVPFYGLGGINYVAHNLETAEEKEEKQAFRKRPEIYGATKEVLLGMANDPSRDDNNACEQPREFCLVELLHYSVDAGQIADVVLARRELGEAYDPNWFDGSAAIEISAAVAKESNVGSDVREAEELIASETDRVDPERLRESLDRLQTAQRGCEDPIASSYFAHQIKTIKNELAFHRGETVPLTFTLELAGWIRDNNKWKVVDRNTIVGDCRGAGSKASMSLFNASHFPTPFIFEAEVTTSKSKDPERAARLRAEGGHSSFNPALLLGSFRKSRHDVQWTQPDGEERTVSLGNRMVWVNLDHGEHGSDFSVRKVYGESYRSIPKPVPSQKLEENTHVITVVAYEHQFFYYINGRKGAPLKYGLDASPVGIGSRVDYAKSGQATFRNLTVRKLQSKSPWFDPEGGIDHYGELIENYPHLVDCHFDRAQVLFSSEQYDKALLDLHEYRKLMGNPLEGPSFELLGDLFMRQGRHDEAIKIFEHQLQDPDKTIQSAAALKLVEILAGAPDEAVRDGKLALKYARLAERIEEFPFNNSKIALAMAYAELGELDKAKQYSKLALENDDADLAYCEDKAQQIEEDGHYRFETKPSQNDSLSFEKLLGRKLPERVKKAQAKDMAEAGRTGQYQIETEKVSTALVKDSIKRRRARPGRAFMSQLANKRKVGLPGVDKPTWQVYAPKDYSDDAEPAFGLMVFMGGEGSTGVIPDESFRKVLDDQRMIFVSPNDTGKGTDAFVCDVLAHEAVNVIRKRYRIDRENVYVGGIGANGFNACHALSKSPRVFMGGFFHSKAAVLQAIDRRKRYVFGIDIWERSRFFFHTSEIDGSLAAAQKKFLALGYKNIKLELSETDEDQLPNAEEFEKGIQFLKSGARFER